MHRGASSTVVAELEQLTMRSNRKRHKQDREKLPGMVDWRREVEKRLEVGRIKEKGMDRMSLIFLGSGQALASTGRRTVTVLQ